MHRYGWYALIGLVVTVIGVTAMLKVQQPTPSTDRLTVVASANFWGDLARQIGGDTVFVSSIITDPEVDPHLYESNAATAAAVSQADIVVLNGLGYDDFAQRILKTDARSDRSVVVAAEVFGIEDEAANPHLWYDLPRVPLMIDAIEQAFVALDRAHAATYRRNADRARASLEPLMDELDAIKSLHPEAPVLYTEPVAAYLLEAAGLGITTPAGFALAIEEGEEPSPADQLAMEALLTSGGVQIFLYNEQAVTPVTEALRRTAERAGVAVVPVTETLPDDEPTFQSWQLHQLQAIRSALAR